MGMLTSPCPTMFQMLSDAYNTNHPPLHNSLHMHMFQCNMASQVLDNMLQLTVEDDGKGYDLGNVTSEGIGLGNIKHRVDYF